MKDESELILLIHPSSFCIHHSSLGNTVVMVATLNYLFNVKEDKS